MPKLCNRKSIKDIFLKYKPDAIMHLAAESHVDNSIENGNPFIHSNIQGTFNLIEVARKNKNLKKFIHISTDEVYGDMDDYGGGAIAREDMTLKGSSYYSASKAASDLLVEAAGRTFDFPYIITRTCNNFGIDQYEEKFLPTIQKSIKADKDTKMGLIGDVKLQLRKAQALKINYSTNPASSAAELYKPY